MQRIAYLFLLLGALRRLLVHLVCNTLVHREEPLVDVVIQMDTEFWKRKTWKRFVLIITFEINLVECYGEAYIFLGRKHLFRENLKGDRNLEGRFYSVLCIFFALWTSFSPLQLTSKVYFQINELVLANWLLLLKYLISLI